LITASIGIIGGADGPASIAVSSTFPWLPIALAAAAAVILTALIVHKKMKA
jgi:Na+-transporting methylmalonyl-CoA/oxaloacetate decarboxylase beta subunit